MAEDATLSEESTEDRGSERDILAEAKEAFELALEVEDENRKLAAEDLRFARLGEQWPEQIRKQRELDHRPILTINKLPAFIRQVVNDARQNKPSIKVHPADSGADMETAEIMNGLIRNIEYTSDAEIAYDTATECAVSMGWGYFKIDIDYAYDDTFDLDLLIHRVADPFSIYGDPFSRAADSSDWNSAFETEWMTYDDFKAEYPDEEDPKDWSDITHRANWLNDKEVMVAKWWQREEVKRIVLQLSDGRTIDEDEASKPAELPEDYGVLPEGFSFTQLDLLEMEGVTVQRKRETRSWKVKRHILTGGKVLKTEDWPGKYIPIVPVYGDEVIDEKGTRHLRSLIRDAKDAQRQFNYWRTTATELIALSPRVPYIGPKGAFASDAKRWATANTESHPYLEYDVAGGGQAPQRQPLDTGVAAGALQEALNASDDMKSIVGIYDPSLGARSNETSGRAILARQKEGDVSTFHFQDNMSRAIRHAGRILIDLIPKVYNSERIVRVIGEDGDAESVPLNKPVPQTDENGQPQMQPVMAPNGQPMMGPDGQPQMEPATRIFDLTAGKYDLTVTTGPSYTTQREEAREQMVAMAQAFPPFMQVAGDLIAKSMDWPGADEIAKRLKSTLPPQMTGGLPPEIQQQMQQGMAMIQSQQQQMKQMADYIAKLEGDLTVDREKNAIDRFEAETDRLETFGKLQSEFNVQVPDTGGQYGDFNGFLEFAKANKLNADADLTRVRTMREAMPQPQPMPQQPSQNPAFRG